MFCMFFFIPLHWSTALKKRENYSFHCPETCSIHDFFCFCFILTYFFYIDEITHCIHTHKKTRSPFKLTAEIFLLILLVVISLLLIIVMLNLSMSKSTSYF